MVAGEGHGVAEVYAEDARCLGAYRRFADGPRRAALGNRKHDLAFAVRFAQREGRYADAADVEDLAVDNDR